jgi:hypothetical protein
MSYNNLVNKLDNIYDLLDTYDNYIRNESYNFIITEMIYDLKEALSYEINKDKELRIELNEVFLECFYDIKFDNVTDKLQSLKESIANIIPEEDNEYYNIVTEGLVASVSKMLSKIKAGFGNKHDKILKRDKKWLAENKKAILDKDYNEIQLEVLSDNKITFENLLNRHNIFDKIFVNTENHPDLTAKLARFEDKNGDLKNGLDNYFKTGTSRREIGLRKVAGKEARRAVENMIEFCESFLDGKKYLEDKLDKILVEVNKSSVKESTIYTIQEVLNEDEDFDDFEDDTDGFEEDKDVKSEKGEPQENKKRTIRDRQIGIAVLLSVAEERYFDYINILRGLVG